jgi:uncharacterized membrane protein YkoI
MNKYLVTAAIGLLFSASAFAQESSEKAIPVAVKTAFSQKFPTAKKVNWDLESATEWEAEFKQDGKEYSVSFSLDGTWLKTEQEIKKSDLPEVIKQTLAKDFDGFRIEEAEISQTPEGSVYEVKVEKGEEEWELVFDANGKLIEKKAIEEDDED